MKCLYCAALALLLAGSLAACGGQGENAPSATATPQPAATAETAPAEESPAPAGEFYTLFGGTFNTGDAFYYLDSKPGYCLVTKVDYTTAQQRVLCTVPGCTHDSDVCPAYVPGYGQSAFLFTVEDTVYVYHGVPAMRFQGSWEEYYAQSVEPYLEEWQASSGMTEEELVEVYRGRYAEAVAPAGIYRIEKDGAVRRDIVCSDDLANVVVRWCDGTALYGCYGGAKEWETSIGYRIDLQDGSVTTFTLLPSEWIAGAQGTRLLTNRVVTEVPLSEPSENWDAYQAALQNAVVEFDWLDPATGERSKVMEGPYNAFSYGNSSFIGLCDGKLYLEDRTVQMYSGYQRNGYYTYDPATGQRQDLVAPLPDSSMRLRAPGVGCLPGSMERQGRYLRFVGSSTGEGDDLAWVLDQQTGELTAVQQKVDGTPWPVHVHALTDDGRFLIPVREQDPYTNGYAYALIDAEAFLQGSTDYTPVKMRG